MKCFASLIIDLPPCPSLCKEQTEACKEIFFTKKDEAGLLRLSQYLNLLDCCLCALVRCYPLWSDAGAMRTEVGNNLKSSWPKLVMKKWLNIKSSADEFHSDYTVKAIMSQKGVSFLSLLLRKKNIVSWSLVFVGFSIIEPEQIITCWDHKCIIT